jgi:hypothetical protein
VTVTRTEILQGVERAFGVVSVSRGDLIEVARREGARPEVLRAIERLPDDRLYGHVRDLWSHLEDVPV